MGQIQPEAPLEGSDAVTDPAGDVQQEAALREAGWTKTGMLSEWFRWRHPSGTAFYDTDTAHRVMRAERGEK